MSMRKHRLCITLAVCLVIANINVAIAGVTGTSSIQG